MNFLGINSIFKKFLRINQKFKKEGAYSTEYTVGGDVYYAKMLKTKSSSLYATSFILDVIAKLGFILIFR